MIGDQCTFECEKVWEVETDVPFMIDIAVLLIFFNRPEKTAAVFEQIKLARPSRLYLYQDGARAGKNDEENVRLCREVTSEIDWQCTVHQLFQPRNYGCDPSEYIAQKWLFTNEKMGIVLEDDDVPAPCFFPFCKELLDRYENDNRIAMICGMNNYDVEESAEESYFFSKRGSIWGWASWRRFFQLWDCNYTWLNDPQKQAVIKNYCDFALDYGQYYKTAVTHVRTGREHYESIMFAAAAIHNMLNVVPKYNMISNIGIDRETTHSVSDIRLLNSRTQKLLYKKVYDIRFPLRHPEKIVQNENFEKKYKINFFQRTWDFIEIMARRILFKYLFPRKPI